MATTTHQIYFQDARALEPVGPDSVDLIFTSPPYPMIAMWDELFTELNPLIGAHLKDGGGDAAYEAMHAELDRVWRKSFDVLKPGGFLVINIGDATRTHAGLFRLFSNHARIIQSLTALGFVPLPNILWRKQTNAPNKFMGSGMLPAGAYVTLEHEYILIFRKGTKREFKTSEDKLMRQQSALFWEERNQWFSDLWFDIKGTRQNMKATDARCRSAAFPFELAYRIVNMFSVRGDVVLDPFLGTGTTTLAALGSGRNSIGFEINPDFGANISQQVLGSADFLNDYSRDRLQTHIEFVADRFDAGKTLKHKNKYYGFPVITAQEKNLQLGRVLDIESTPDGFTARFAPDEGDGVREFRAS